MNEVLPSNEGDNLGMAMVRGSGFREWAMIEKSRGLKKTRAEKDVG
jgi:hypothetical protein